MSTLTMATRKPPTPAEIFETRLLDVDDVATKTGMSAQWVRDHSATLNSKARRHPKLVGMKMGDRRGGGVWRYTEHDVGVFLEELRNGA